MPPGLNEGHPVDWEISSIAIGTERMIVGGAPGVFEWAIPDRPANRALQLQGLLAVPRPRTYIPHPNPLYGFLAEPHALSVQPQSVQVCPDLLM